MKHFIRDKSLNHTVALTQHARDRAHQRLIADEVIKTVMLYADISLKVGSGCSKNLISKRARNEAKADGVPQKLLARAQNTVVILSDDETVVTLYKRQSTSTQDLSRRPRCRRKSR